MIIICLCENFPFSPFQPYSGWAYSYKLDGWGVGGKFTLSLKSQKGFYEAKVFNKKKGHHRNFDQTFNDVMEKG